MQKNRIVIGINLVLTVAVSLALGLAVDAQSNDIDQPTALTSNVIEGEGDGNGETLYYSFTAQKGDVKVTLDAKTDNYSAIMDAALLTADGAELLKVSAVANDTGKRQVGTKHFVRDTKVILRVRLPKDDHLKLLTYKIKLDGSVVVEAPPVPATTPTPTPTVMTDVAPAAATESAQPVVVTAAVEPAALPTATDPTSLKAKAKAKANAAAKKAMNSKLDN
jgi:hypothetical protein